MALSSPQVLAAGHLAPLDQSAPRVMDQADRIGAMAATQAPALSTALPAAIPLVVRPGPQREVFGFVNENKIGDPAVGYTSWNFRLLTTVAFFGLHINSGDGNFVTTDAAWTSFHSTTMRYLLNTAHANGVRVIASLNLHDGSTNPSGPMCNGLTATSAQNTINQTLALIVNTAIDGVNFNYEGTNTTCADGLTSRDELTALVKNLRAAMPSGYIAIDTYGGSAEDNLEFFNVTGLAPYVDAEFVMAYDMDQSNYFETPLYCSAFCFSPVSPLNTYRFNVSKTIAQYTALIPASKVILGQPYYGRRGCVANLTSAHQLLTRDEVSTTYLFASTIPSQTGVSNFAAHRDPLEGVSKWDTWYDSDWACNRLQYYDDAFSLAAKYDLVNRSNLGGVGFFTLDYGGGAPELWSLIATYFSCPVTITAPATATTTQYSVQLAAGSCAVAYYDVDQFDTTLGEGLFGLAPVGPSGSTSVEGYQGHGYQVFARAHSAGGIVGAWAEADTQVSPTATKSHAWNGLYTLDGYGGIHAADSPPLDNAPYWPWPAARAVHAAPGTSAPQAGFILDAFGGLHPYGGPALQVGVEPYYPGQDVARDFVFLPDASGGYELDGYGGIHPFSIGANAMPPAPSQFPYFAGQDVARKITLLADGSGGYVLDIYGGIHPWSATGHALPAAITQHGYWAGSNVARDIWLDPAATSASASGYVMDLYGGFHPFWGGTAAAPTPIATYGYWAGMDIARAAFLLPGATPATAAGYTLDAYGGIHPFSVGGQALPAAISQYGYWPGQDVARSLWGA
ncbi:MAG: glycosyl hydrolase family 18 protein [Solirubrobacteraceae bacterium]